MKMRIDDHDKFREEPLRAMPALESYVHVCGLEPKLAKMRASQICGCAHCLDMHPKTRALGETELRLYALNAWRETLFYTERERAALEWAEALTLVSQTHVPHEVYEAVRKHFGEKELLGLTFAVVAINLWNRLAVSLRAVPGRYQPKKSFAPAS
jgi:AhpD family alkylhydroperoxidase